MASLSGLTDPPGGEAFRYTIESWPDPFRAPESGKAITVVSRLMVVGLIEASDASRSIALLRRKEMDDPYYIRVGDVVGNRRVTSIHLDGVESIPEGGGNEDVELIVLNSPRPMAFERGSDE
jgi:hypothetical protein